MKFKKLILTFTTFPIITFVTSCNNVISEKEGLFIEAALQRNPNRAHAILTNITRNKIKLFHGDLSKQKGVPLLSGGFGESRNFYSSLNKYSVHTGIDVFLNEGHQVFAPYDADIIAYWGKTTTNELGGGFGGQAILRVKITDIDLRNIKLSVKNQKYLYLTFGHLDPEKISLIKPIAAHSIKTISGEKTKYIYSDISPQNVWHVKAGQLMGFVGKFQNNGGWIPHLHLEVYKGDSDKFNDHRISIYKPSLSWTQKEFIKNKYIFSAIKGTGVFMLPRGSKEKNLAYFHGGNYSVVENQKHVTKHISIKKSFVYTHGILNPNKIYHLYNKNSQNIII